jgi:predicted metal-dependent phosphotriesterase family hydrolase
MLGVAPLFAYRRNSPAVMTVTGPLSPDRLGITLPHEHILVDFIGADKIGPGRYDAEEVIRTALPYLRELKERGCQTLIECTPAYLGRDAVLLQRLSRESGLQILSNTGYYGAVDGKYLPAHAYTESARQLSARWLREWNEGIDGTDIRPGFMKISVDQAPLKDFHRKLLEAAALTHLESGLPIASHTGNGPAALEELQILQQNGVDGRSFIWVHAQNETNPEIHRQAARQGAWIELDGISPESLDAHRQAVVAMKKAGFLGQTLISHDAGWYHVGEPGGGNFRPYTLVFDEFLPALRKEGFSEAEIRRLMVTNPREAFSIRVRAMKKRK